MKMHEENEKLKDDVNKIPVFMKKVAIAFEKMRNRIKLLTEENTKLKDDLNQITESTRNLDFLNK
jgi:hypothetical protein